MVRNGLRGRTQRYKCKDCDRRFDGGIRRDKSKVISDYIEGKQTLGQLATKYGVCEKTIRRDLEGMRYIRKIANHKDVTIQMDTTYWAGILVLWLSRMHCGMLFYGTSMCDMKQSHNM